MIAAAIWRVFFISTPVLNEKVGVAPEEHHAPTYDERVTINETYEQQDAHNFHIEEIDFKDNVMVDQNPRKRKRL